VVVGGVRCTPYIIGDAAYPIRPHLQKIGRLVMQLMWINKDMILL
jgi:hypothetical protein